MHIPDAYLSPQTQAVAFAVMAPLWALAVRRSKGELTASRTPLLSLGAAFCFAIQFLNVPAPGGTTAHPLGAALLAILVGPWSASIAMSVTLLVQGVVFGDGGVLSLGVNCWNMGLVAVLVATTVHRLCAGTAVPGSRRWLTSAAAASYCGTVCAAISAGLILGIQPLVAHDRFGHALYCPFGLGIAVPAMAITHLLAAAPADAIVTVGALAYVARSFPALLSTKDALPLIQRTQLGRAVAVLLALTPLGLLASGAAWGEWELKSVAEKVGYTPAGSAAVRPIMTPMLPDYGLANSSGWAWLVLGCLVSAAVGAVLVSVFTRALVRGTRTPDVKPASVARGNEPMPSWMLEERRVPRAIGRSHTDRWLRELARRLSQVIAEGSSSTPSATITLGAQPGPKAIAAISLLVAIGLCPSPAALAFVLVAVWTVAAMARCVSVLSVRRVIELTSFFGLCFALPAALSFVTPGPPLLSLHGLAVTRTGLALAATISLRLAAGLSIVSLWSTTTPWRHQLTSLKAIGLPAPFISAAMLAYRYQFVLLDTLLGMVDARAAREVGGAGRNAIRRYTGVGTAILFAKSASLAEELSWAMSARGIGLSAPAKRDSWTLLDWGLAAAGVALVISAVWLRSSHAF